MAQLDVHRNANPATREQIGNLSDERRSIIAALDLLITGI